MRSKFGNSYFLSWLNIDNGFQLKKNKLRSGAKGLTEQVGLLLGMDDGCDQLFSQWFYTAHSFFKKYSLEVFICSSISSDVTQDPVGKVQGI